MNQEMNEWNTHRLLSRKEAADFLGVKEITLSIWHSTQRYKIPVVKVGRLARYRISDLVAFAESRTVNKLPAEEIDHY
jgi:hypothetical protein